jgi:SAM-dependent methyltransferase
MTTSIEFDFEALYRGEPLFPEGHPLRAVYQGIVPWEIGRPQPAITNLAKDGGFRGQVLDVGCGLGENALYLAARGLDVTGIDIAPTAIRRAGARAEELGLEVEFLVADATTLDGLAGRTFDTILDSGLYHGLTADQRRACLAALHRAAAPGARLYLHCASDALPPQIAPPHPYTEHDVRQSLTDAGWIIIRFADSSHATNPALTRDLLRQAMRATNAHGGERFAESLKTDEHGRLLMPAWSITAQRIEDQR